jgi:hypothetical protein
MSLAVSATNITESSVAIFNGYMIQRELPYTLDMLDDWRTKKLWMIGDEDGPWLQIEIHPSEGASNRITDSMEPTASQAYEIRISVSGSFASQAMFIAAGLAFALNGEVHDMQCVAMHPAFAAIMKANPIEKNNLESGLYDADFAFKLGLAIKSVEDKRSK